MWPEGLTLSALNELSKNTLLEHVDIQVTEIGEDYLRASMPVDSRTHQTMGLLHGGASVVLAESLGSLASNILVAPNSYGVGLEINANHLRSVSSGHVHATARAVHVGRSTHVWDIRIVDDNDKNICISRLTVAILAPKA